MKKIVSAVIAITLLAMLSACGNKSPEQSNTEGGNPSGVTESVPISSENANMNTENIPQELQPIPADYDSPAEQQGSLVELMYDTFESTTYEQKTQAIQKRAIVYLPYNYSDDQKYNVLYLMHGGWSNETSLLGTQQQPSSFKNVVDNAIQNGDFDPLIIVCPTYNNESPEDSSNYSLAFNTLTVNYHNELTNDLIPAVEGTYSTYTESTAPEELKASRDHRAFGGFSMGSVTTWYTFINCLDQLRIT